MPITLDHMRRFAVSQSLFAPTSLKRALNKMGFVQADPIRAPARAQDLILRHRVENYRAGDLERHYAKLDVWEDAFVNYGFVTAFLQTLMHPRPTVGVPAGGSQPWSRQRRSRAQLLLEFVRERGEVHPREVDEYFSHGTVTNYWGGSSNATTHLLDAMHYRGVLRVVRRERGIRIYAAHEPKLETIDAAECRVRMDALADAAIRIYQPCPLRSLSLLLRRLRIAVPQWRNKLTGAIQRAKERLPRARVDGVEWYWVDGGPFQCDEAPDVVRLLAPFDPVVWDRDRFELLWGWTYRFEAYTPPARRKLGYYALPLLWRDQVIGWGNVAVKNGELHCEFGYVGSKPTDQAFSRELDLEVERMRAFLGLC
ncbi:MAG TPA: crosslink repair DNA glycosylase YcaQ family protein [Terriglobales bacterium]|nr:crosslink repair DNA glycosylase YcaQ family protein [Terriglobales bacterium]